MSLRIEHCEKCTSLPPFGQLSWLKDLIIKGMIELKSIGCEFYGEDCWKPFQSLEALYFEDLQEWEQWDHIKENDQVESFPSLRELYIAKCPKISGRLLDCLPSSEKLMI